MKKDVVSSKLAIENQTIQGLQDIQKKKFYRAKEVSVLIGVGLSTVWAWSKQGRITPIKISSRITVFSIDEINKMLEAS